MSWGHLSRLLRRRTFCLWNVRVFINKPAFAWLPFTLVFFLAWGHPHLLACRRDSPKTWDMAILSSPICPATSPPGPLSSLVVHLRPFYFKDASLQSHSSCFRVRPPWLPTLFGTYDHLVLLEASFSSGLSEFYPHPHNSCSHPASPDAFSPLPASNLQRKLTL